MTTRLAIDGPANGQYIDAVVARKLGYVEHTWPTGELVWAEEDVLLSQEAESGNDGDHAGLNESPDPRRSTP